MSDTRPDTSPLSSECKHEIDFNADGQMIHDGETRWIIDVRCKHCGRSGSFLVDNKTEVNWE